MFGFVPISCHSSHSARKEGESERGGEGQPVNERMLRQLLSNHTTFPQQLSTKFSDLELVISTAGVVHPGGHKNKAVELHHSQVSNSYPPLTSQQKPSFIIHKEIELWRHFSDAAV